MTRTAVARKTRHVTWKEVEAFAAETGRDPSHVYRVITGKRQSGRLEAELAEHFGAPFENIALAGRTAA